MKGWSTFSGSPLGEVRMWAYMINTREKHRHSSNSPGKSYSAQLYICTTTPSRRGVGFRDPHSHKIVYVGGTFRDVIQSTGSGSLAQVRTDHIYLGE